MELTPVERAILMNQNLILALLEPDGREGYEKRAEAYLRGYEAEYDLGIWDDQPPMPEAVSRRVHDVMTMFRHLKREIARYPELDEAVRDDLSFSVTTAITTASTGTSSSSQNTVAGTTSRTQRR